MRPLTSLRGLSRLPEARGRSRGVTLTIAVLDVNGGLCLQQQRDEVQAAAQGCVVQC